MDTWMWIAGFALTAALGVVLGVRVRLANQRDKAQGHARCPRCTQKLRFPLKKEGQVGRCPRCQAPLVLADAQVGPLELSRSGLMRVIRQSRREAAAQ